MGNAPWGAAPAGGRARRARRDFVQLCDRFGLVRAANVGPSLWLAFASAGGSKVFTGGAGCKEDRAHNV